MRLYVDGQIVIDRWAAEPGPVSGSLDLMPGEHDVVVEYFNASGPAFISVGWSESNDYPDWRGEYFASPELTGAPALIRNDPAVNFNWGRSGPSPGVLAADNFAARWTRSLEFVDGVYRWTVIPDDGARLLVDGQIVLDAWQGPAGQEVTAETTLAAGRHSVAVELRNSEGAGGIALSWNVVIAEETPTPEIPSPPTTEPSTATPDQPTATPEATSLPTATPTDTPTVVPGSTATATPTDDPNTTATPTATVDPNTTVTPTPTGATGTPTPTPTSGSATPTPTPTPRITPEGNGRNIDVSPFPALPGDEILLTSGNWTPGIRVSVSIVESGLPYSQAVAIEGTTKTTPTNPANPVTIQFIFPDDSRWVIGTDVWIYIHNADWTEWGQGELELNEDQ
ncbi:MAG: PA14 domain-containing protein [Caldilineales bacterium]